MGLQPVQGLASYSTGLNNPHLKTEYLECVFTIRSDDSHGCCLAQAAVPHKMHLFMPMLFYVKTNVSSFLFYKLCEVSSSFLFCD